MKARFCSDRMLLLTALVSLLLAGLAASSPDLFDNQLGDINYCKLQCQLVIKNKSPAKDSVMNACHRGCRLYSICQFVNGNAGFNTSREECQGACQEAYVKLLEQEACCTGCASQPSEPELLRRKLKAMTHRPKQPSVVEAMSGWFNDIVSSAQSFISSSWTFYLQADDGKVVVFQNRSAMEDFMVLEVELQFSAASCMTRSTEFNPVEGIAAAARSELPFWGSAGPGGVTSPAMPAESRPDADYNLPELQAPEPHPHPAEKPWLKVHAHTQRPHGARGHREKGAPGPAGKGKRAGQHPEDTSTEHDFLGCMSRRSGLPRWILAACLFLSIMVMLWLSCASLVTAPEQHIKTQLSINGDKEFIDERGHKVNPYHLTPVIAVTVKQLHPDEHQEAGPLPVKVDLDKTCV
ncbi:unnamed protein product [Arctogadus glacialis]